MVSGLIVPRMTFVAPLCFNELQFQIVNGYKFSHDQIGMLISSFLCSIDI